MGPAKYIDHNTCFYAIYIRMHSTELVINFLILSKLKKLNMHRLLFFFC